MDTGWSLVKRTRRAATVRRLRLVALLLLAFGLSVVAVGLAACGDADDGDPLGPEPEPRPPAPSLTADDRDGDTPVEGADITGRIVTVSAAATPAGEDSGAALVFLIEDGVGEVDKASVTATAATRWYRLVADALVEVGAVPDREELAGTRVAVAFYGPVAESYPVQAAAGWVVLLD
jgi:hypothetical protein